MHTNLFIPATAVSERPAPRQPKLICQRSRWRISASWILPLLLLLALPATVQAQFNYTSDDSSITITGYTGPGGALAIPSTINGLPVTSIGYRAFYGCISLTSVTIPDSVASIGDWALYGCTGLTNVTIPGSVTRIGNWSFYGCTGLTGMAIPDSVISIGNNSFAGCTSLTNVTISGSLTNIGSWSFYGCTGLTSVTIPDSVTRMGNGAFSGCTWLASVTIPDSITRIELSTFSGCTRLTRVTIPHSVTSIGDRAFSDCTRLTSVTIPNSVISIGNWTFYGCTRLKAITVDALNPAYASVAGVLFDRSQSTLLAYPGGKAGDYIVPGSVTNIGRFAFCGCTSLTSLTVPNSVTGIGDEAFLGCIRLSGVTIPDSVTSIGDSAFYGCTRLTSATIPDSVTSIGYAYVPWLHRLTSVTIPDSVTIIRYGAFSGCTRLTNVIIPSSVTSIEGYAFYGCTNLTGAYFQGHSPSVGDSVFEGDNHATVYYLPGTTGWGPTFGGRPAALCRPDVNGTKSTLAIIAPTASQRWSNAVFTVKGTARDNVQVSKVWCQTNGVWGPVSTYNNWTNWTVDVALAPGANTVKAYAVDGAGNRSATSSVSFFYVVPSPLTLLTSGVGTIRRNFRGTRLEVGRSYTVTGVPGAGQVFSNWVGSVTSGSARLSFLMQPDMVLQANFIPNPFLRAKGTYNGLFAEAGRAQESSGFVTLAVTDKGAYSGTLRHGTNSYPLSGQFGVSGSASQTVLRPRTNSWAVTLGLDLAGGEVLTGTVGDGHWLADLRADRAVFNALTNPATQYAGRYTLIIPGSTDASASPGGESFGAVVVTGAGQVAFKGALADGSAMSQSVSLSREGRWPLYASLYGGKGSIWGWLAFDTNQPAAGLQGEVSWIKPAQAGGKYYLAGFTNDVVAVGSRYTQPAGLTNRVIHLTNGVVSFEGGNLSAPFTNLVSLTLSNKVVNASSNSLSLSLTLSSGLFSGSATVPGMRQSVSFKGALLQNLDAGYGYFLGTNQSGSVYFGE